MANYYKSAAAVCALLLITLELCAQTLPFSLPPRWYFGHQSGLNFTAGAPTFLAGNPWDGSTYNNQESYSTECFPSGNVAYYSNSCQVKDGAHVTRATTFLGTGNSSTQGTVSIPDPASPTNQYYMITASVESGGGSNCTQSAYGIYAYPVNAAGVVTLGAPTLLFAGGAGSSGPLNEAIAAGTDYDGGYWVVAANYISGSGTIRFISWHITAAGIDATTVTSPAGNIVTGEWNFQAQGSIKLNRCNNRIAYIQHGTSGGANNYWVYNWDARTGRATTLVRAGVTGSAFNYGCEFSPDGNMLYVTSLSEGGTNGLRQINLTTGANNVIDNAPYGAGYTGFGNLNLGPDNRIYVSHAYSAFETGPKYLAVINTPDGTTVGACGYVKNGFTLTATASQLPSVCNGLITLSWHNPVLTINTSASPCQSFSYTYQQYYGANITVQSNSEEWDFGEGGGWETSLGATPTHVYSSNGTKTVKLRLRDQYCQVLYENERNITVSCVLPVELIHFDANKSGNTVALTWATAMEVNNDYFLVQRSSDGENFTTIGTVDGNGNSTSRLDYAFTDFHPLAGTNYYRLLQYDFDGRNEASPTRAVEMDVMMVSVFPNPSNANFNVQISGGSESQIVVTDVLGRVVYTTTSSGDEIVSFGAELAKGIYVVSVSSGDEVSYHKIEKQ